MKSKKRWRVRVRTARLLSANWIVFPYYYECRNWVPEELDSLPDVSNVACAHVIWGHHPGVIRATSRRVQVQNHFGGGCTLEGCNRLPKECQKQEWCPSDGIGTCMQALSDLGWSRVIITKVWGWIPGKVTSQGSKVISQMIEAVIRGDQNILSWDGGTQGWLQRRSKESMELEECDRRADDWRSARTWHRRQWQIRGDV